MWIGLIKKMLTLDDSSFDQLACKLASSTSRRSVLKSLAAMAVTMYVGMPQSATAACDDAAYQTCVKRVQDEIENKEQECDFRNEACIGELDPQVLATCELVSVQECLNDLRRLKANARKACTQFGCRVNHGCCNGQCISVTTTYNCGFCGNVCPPTSKCINQQCVGADCRHDSQCSFGQKCVQGHCQCPTGQTLCGSTCTQIFDDINNCGGCGKACAPGQRCVNGVCISCLTNSDCGNGQVCANNQCECQAGQTLCNGTCTDITSSAEHCGGCGNLCQGQCINATCECNPPCTGGKECINGQCQCPAGQTLCNDQCSFLTDCNNCGACGQTCGPCEVCNAAGELVSKCDPNQCEVCEPGGTCVNSCNGTCFECDGEGHCTIPKDCGGCAVCDPSTGLCSQNSTCDASYQQCVGGTCCQFAQVCDSRCCLPHQICKNGVCTDLCAPGTRACVGIGEVAHAAGCTSLDAICWNQPQGLPAACEPGTNGDYNCCFFSPYIPRVCCINPNIVC